MSVGRRRPGPRPPWIVVPFALAGVALFLLPLVGLLARAPWRDLGSQLTSPAVGNALRLSMVCSLAAVVASLVVGLPLAWLLARWPFPGRRLLRALVTLPMILPPVVGGVALLQAFGRRGVVGRFLTDVPFFPRPFTTSGAALAATFVAMPFFVITVEAGLRAADPRYEEASMALGAGRWMTFRRVTLPLIRPSLVAGAALAWARAVGEFGATVTFAGNNRRTQTMPLAVYLAFETNPEQAVLLGLVLLAVSLAVLVSLRDRWLGTA